MDLNSTNCPYFGPMILAYICKKQKKTSNLPLIIHGNMDYKLIIPPDGLLYFCRRMLVLHQQSLHRLEDSRMLMLYCFDSCSIANKNAVVPPYLRISVSFFD